MPACFDLYPLDDWCNSRPKADGILAYRILYGAQQMNPFSLAAMSAQPFRLWSTFMWRAGEMMLASAQVIGYRTSPIRSSRDSSGTRNRRELALMGTEKVGAAAESVQAAAASWIQLNQEFSAIVFNQALVGLVAMGSIAASRTPAQVASRQVRLVSDTLSNSTAAASRLSGTAARGAQRILKPVHSRATANAKRLAKR